MTITSRAFPRHNSAPKYYAGVESMIRWGGNYSVPADSQGRHNAMVQKDEVVDALAWAWAVMNDSQDIIKSVVCRFFGEELAAEVAGVIDWFDVEVFVQTGGWGLSSFQTRGDTIVLSVRDGHSDEPAGLFECLVAKISAEANVASDSTECALINMVSSIVHEMVHVLVGGDADHVPDNCWNRSENCDPTSAMDCRLMEALSLAYGAGACAAPCSEMGGPVGELGACPRCQGIEEGAAGFVNRNVFHPIAVASGCGR